VFGKGKGEEGWGRRGREREGRVRKGQEKGEELLRGGNGEGKKGSDGPQKRLLRHPVIKS